MLHKLIFTIILLFPKFSLQFYVVEVAPTDFNNGQQIEVEAVKMTSIHTQLPYEHYSLPICLPKDGNIQYKSRNFGEVVSGDRIVNTPYDLKVAENKLCTLLCHSPYKPIQWNAREAQLVIDRIQHEYFVHLLIDNLPALTPVNNPDTNELQYEHGYRLGNVMGNETYINNHLKLTLLYHNPTPNVYHVVGFHVDAKSVHSDDLKFEGNTCLFPIEPKPQLVDPASGTKLYFTYEVEWELSNINWTSRWDTYLAICYRPIQLFSVINSIVVIIFLSGIIITIMMRTLRKDAAKINTDEGIDEAVKETGWKLVHGDVFRPPKNSKFFAVIIGSGIQIISMALIPLFVVLLGMVLPAPPDALIPLEIVLYNLMGFVAGYFSARLYKTMKGQEWQKTAFLTAILYPAIIAGTCFFLNFFIWGEKSSGALPFSTIIVLVLLRLAMSMPMVLFGSYVGYNKQLYEHPVLTNQHPRQVPKQHWYKKQIQCALVTGLLPFGVVFIELHYVFTAIWKNKITCCYDYGFLFLTCIILIICCSQISVIMVYRQLCDEDYHWWWRSFAVSGGSALYILGYSLFYFVTQLEITEFVPILLYFAYTGLMILTFWLMTGTIGFYAAYAFIRKIYRE